MNSSAGIGNVHSDNCSFKWTINNFCTGCKNVGESLLSPEFSSGLHSWVLQIFPKGETEANTGYMALFIRLNSGSSVDLLCKLSIINKAKTAIHRRKFRHKYSDTSGWGYAKFIQRNLLSNDADGVLVNDKLTIRCELVFDSDDMNSNQETLLSLRKKERLRLEEFDALEELVDNEDFSDVTVTANDVKFHAHKCILASRSPVFSAMLTHDTKEKRENQIVIEDINSDVLKEVLRFIYTGKVTPKGLQKFGKELLGAADKYALSGLQFLCEEVLCDNLSSDNAIDYLKFADLYDNKILKSRTIAFIANHSNEIISRLNTKK